MKEAAEGGRNFFPRGTASVGSFHDFEFFAPHGKSRDLATTNASNTV
jgi:hypothetical protein